MYNTYELSSSDSSNLEINRRTIYSVDNYDNTMDIICSQLNEFELQNNQESTNLTNRYIF